MKIDVRRNAIILVFFLAGLVLIWAGLNGRFGLLLGAVFVPEYLTVEASSGG